MGLGSSKRTQSSSHELKYRETIELPGAYTLLRLTYCNLDGFPPQHKVWTQCAFYNARAYKAEYFAVSTTEAAFAFHDTSTSQLLKLCCELQASINQLESTRALSWLFVKYSRWEDTDSLEKVLKDTYTCGQLYRREVLKSRSFYTVLHY